MIKVLIAKNLNWLIENTPEQSVGQTLFDILRPKHLSNTSMSHEESTAYIQSISFLREIDDNDLLTAVERTITDVQ